MTHLLRRALFLLALMFSSLPASADNLVTVQPVAVPALAAPAQALLEVDGRAVALNERGAWLLDGQPAAWTPLRWS
ncbi:MAG TPA: hypothetical protein VFF16_04475, partial [Telluria sp.]|nr:hypothetical protein [Telluria sp.]